MRSVSARRGLVLLGAMFAPWSLAAENPAAPVTLSQPSAAPMRSTAGIPAGRVDGLGPRVDAATLGRLSGGTEVSQEMTLTGTVGNNQIDHAVSGSNVISSGSFDGATGLPMVIQNTGNGVLIQNATIISVKLQP